MLTHAILNCSCSTLCRVAGLFNTEECSKILIQHVSTASIRTVFQQLGHLGHAGIGQSLFIGVQLSPFGVKRLCLENKRLERTSMCLYAQPRANHFHSRMHWQSLRNVFLGGPERGKNHAVKR